MKLHLWSAGLVVLFLACEPRPAEVAKPPLDINTLLATQANTLSQYGVSLIKTAAVENAVPDTTTRVLTSKEWSVELDAFRDLGMINKQSTWDLYHSEGPLDDPRSNLHIQRYSSDKTPLRTLSIYYSTELQRMHRIEGVVHEENSLYTAHRNLLLEFEDVQGKPLLTHYEIRGYQKLALRDSVPFRIHGVIKW